MLILTNNYENKVCYARFVRNKCSIGYGDVLDANGIEDPGFKYNRAPAGVSLSKSSDPPNTFVPSYRLQLKCISFLSSDAPYSNAPKPTYNPMPMAVQQTFVSQPPPPPPPPMQQPSPYAPAGPNDMG